MNGCDEVDDVFMPSSQPNGHPDVTPTNGDNPDNELEIPDKNDSGTTKNGIRRLDPHNAFNIRDNEVRDNSSPVANCDRFMKNLSMSPESSRTCNTRADTRDETRGASEPPSTERTKSHGDDMNGYFHANLHLLEYLSNDGRHEGGPGRHSHRSFHGNDSGSLLYPNNYCDNNSSSDDEGMPRQFVNNIYPAIDPHDDDQGDFIETDIPAPNPYDFLNTGSDVELSDDENHDKDDMYDFMNLNHDRHKKETIDKVFQSFERSRNYFEVPVLARPSFQQEIPQPHPESISLWSPEIEYPELNSTDGSSQSRARDGAMNIGVSMSSADDVDISDLDEEPEFAVPTAPNNLNEVFSSETSSDHDDELFNVSRQTSTSNFDNDENSFQGDDQDTLYLNGLDADVVEQLLLAEELNEHSDHHTKRRVGEHATGRGPYSRLLDYDPSTSDEDADDGEAALFLEHGPITDGDDLSPERQSSPQPGGSGDSGDVANSQDPSQVVISRSSHSHRRSGKIPIPKVMVWSEYEAYISQVKQIGRSACGPTAVINVLKAFDVFCDKEKIKNVISTNLRAEKGPLSEYLFSRSIAGTTAERLVDGIMKLTDGAIYGRFFCFYPKCKIDLTRWLGYWISKGAVPMVTLNLQKAVPPGWVTPDAWHHQMVYGVGPKGIYLTNPLEILPVPIIEQQLCSESVLLVRRSDVVSRWTEASDLHSLMGRTDPRWTDFNVLGQVVSVLREAAVPGFQGYKLPWTSHIRIPCCYKPGVSLFVKADSDSYALLQQTEPLVVEKQTVNSASNANSP